MGLTERELLDLKLRAELGPDNPALQLELAEAYERAGLNEAANHAFQRVLALDPRSAPARRGRLRYFRRRYADAAARADGYERATIVHQVGELGDRTATLWLLGLLGDDEPVVCQKAAEALGKTGDRAAVPALIRLLRSDAACGKRNCAIPAGIASHKPACKSCKRASSALQSEHVARCDSICARSGSLTSPSR